MNKFFSDLINAFGYSKELNPHEVDCEQVGTYPKVYVDAMVEVCLKYGPDMFDLTKMVFSHTVSDLISDDKNVVVDIEIDNVYIAGHNIGVHGSVYFPLTGTPMYILVQVNSHTTGSYISMNLNSVKDMSELATNATTIVPVAFGYANPDGKTYTMEVFDNHRGINRYHFTEHKELHGIMTSDDKGLVYDN